MKIEYMLCDFSSVVLCFQSLAEVSCEIKEL